MTLHNTSRKDMTMSGQCMKHFSHNVMASGIICAHRRNDARELVHKMNTFLTSMKDCCGESYIVSSTEYLKTRGMTHEDAVRLVNEALVRLEQLTDPQLTSV